MANCRNRSLLPIIFAACLALMWEGCGSPSAPPPAPNRVTGFDCQLSLIMTRNTVEILESNCLTLSIGYDGEARIGEFQSHSRSDVVRELQRQIRPGRHLGLWMSTEKGRTKESAAMEQEIAQFCVAQNLALYMPVPLGIVPNSDEIQVGMSVHPRCAALPMDEAGEGR